MTGALHVLQLQLSPPPPSSLAPIKLANPGSPGKMAVKTEREREMFYTAVVVDVVFAIDMMTKLIK